MTSSSSILHVVDTLQSRTFALAVTPVCSLLDIHINSLLLPRFQLSPQMWPQKGLPCPSRFKQHLCHTLTVFIAAATWNYLVQ